MTSRSYCFIADHRSSIGEGTICCGCNKREELASSKKSYSQCRCRMSAAAIVFIVLIVVALAVPTAAVGDKVVAFNTKKKEDIIVETKEGKVRGVRYFLPTLAKSVIAYLGIPYAKPPTGHRRFKHPEPVEPWTNVLNATRLPNSCYQPDDLVFGDFYGSTMWNSPTKISEDCLYLNVWVPNIRKHPKKLAVLVWIFGGGFYSGTSTLNLYDGKLLAAMNDVIVVSFNYRVTVFGFLALGHPAAPGNAGLYDQLMALEWVQRNIENFGGNPRNVTLFGESAGAVSVSLHLLSPLSVDKFERAVMQSGTANMRWATLTVDQARKRAFDFAFEMDGVKCPHTDDMAELAACLRTISPDRLLAAHWVSRNIMQFPFLPVIDGVFLSDSPDELLRRGSFKKCPIIIGSNKNEGSYFIIYELPHLLQLNFTKMDAHDMTKSFQHLFNYYPQYPTPINSFGLEAIKFQYANSIDPNDMHENLRLIDEAASDCYFICHLNEFALTYAAANCPVYSYYLTERYAANPWPEWMGVLHGDDVIFIFGDNLRPGQNASDEERQLTKDIMKYWANFAKTGDPNQSPGHPSENVWPRHTPQRREYFELNSKFVNEVDKRKAIGRGPRTKECAFWLEYLPSLVASTDNLLERVGDAVKTSQPSKENFSCPVLPLPSIDGNNCGEGGKRCSYSSSGQFCSSSTTILVSVVGTLILLHYVAS